MQGKTEWNGLPISVCQVEEPRQGVPQKLHKITHRSHLSRKQCKKRAPKRNLLENVDNIKLESGEEVYSYISWEGDNGEKITPPTNTGKLVDIKEYKEVDSIKSKNHIR